MAGCAVFARWRLLSLHRPSAFCRPLHHRHYRHQQLPRGSALSSALCSNLNYSTQAIPRAVTMDANTKQHYLADSPPTVVRLEAKQHFDRLEDPELRKYAHYISRFVFPLAALA